MITCGMPYSSLPMCPAMLAYQVCECSSSTLPVAATIDRSTDSVVSAGFAPARSGSGRWPCAAGPVVAEAMHVDIDQFAEFADQVFDVNTGPSVDVRREFSGQDRGMHDGNLSSPPGSRRLEPGPDTPVRAPRDTDHPTKRAKRVRPHARKPRVRR